LAVKNVHISSNSRDFAEAGREIALGAGAELWAFVRSYFRKQTTLLFSCTLGSRSPK